MMFGKYRLDLAVVHRARLAAAATEDPYGLAAAYRETTLIALAGYRSGNTAVTQQCEAVVDCRHGDMDIVFLYRHVKLACSEGPGGYQGGVEHHLALLRQARTDMVEIFDEYPAPL